MFNKNLFYSNKSIRDNLIFGREKVIEELGNIDELMEKLAKKHILKISY